MSDKLIRNKSGKMKHSSSGNSGSSAETTTAPSDHAVARSLGIGRAPSFATVTRMGKSPSLRFDINSQTESSFLDAAQAYRSGNSGSALKTPLRHFRKGSMRPGDPVMHAGPSSLKQKRFKMHGRKEMTVMPNSRPPMDRREVPESMTNVIQSLCTGKEVRCFVPVKTLSHPSPDVTPVEYLVLAVKPFKNKARVILIRGTIYSISVVRRWKLDELAEYDRLAPISMTAYLEGTAGGSFSLDIFGRKEQDDSKEDDNSDDADEKPSASSS